MRDVYGPEWTPFGYLSGLGSTLGYENYRVRNPSTRGHLEFDCGTAFNIERTP